MIKKVEVLLTFPLGAKFQGNIYLIIYKKFVRFVKELMCFNVDSKCIDCKFRTQCKYYNIFGENFKGYPGILIENRLLFKREIPNGNQLLVNFYIIGNSCTYFSYISLFFDSLNQKLLGNIFYLNSIKTVELDNNCNCIDLYVDFITPIETINIRDSYNCMVGYYNDKYQCDYSLIEDDISLPMPKKMKWPSIYLGTKKVEVDGYVGNKVKLNKFNNGLLTIGIGKFNFIGGGQVEI